MPLVAPYYLNGHHSVNDKTLPAIEDRRRRWLRRRAANALYARTTVSYAPVNMKVSLRVLNPLTAFFPVPRMGRHCAFSESADQAWPTADETASNYTLL